MENTTAAAIKPAGGMEIDPAKAPIKRRRWKKKPASNVVREEDNNGHPDASEATTTTTKAVPSLSKTRNNTQSSTETPDTSNKVPARRNPRHNPRQTKLPQSVEGSNNVDATVPTSQPPNVPTNDNTKKKRPPPKKKFNKQRDSQNNKSGEEETEIKEEVVDQTETKFVAEIIETKPTQEVIASASTEEARFLPVSNVSDEKPSNLPQSIESAVEDVKSDQPPSDIGRPVETENKTSFANKPSKTLLLPEIPTASKKVHRGIPRILSRQSNPPQSVSDSTQVDEDNPNQQQPTDSTNEVVKKKKTVTKKKVKRVKDSKTDEETKDVEEEIVEPTIIESATEALEKLPGQEVSITSTTVVKVFRSASTNSLEKKANATQATNATTKVKPLPKKKAKALSSDAKVNLKAARRFNNDVRMCVEQSDPDSMREILHDSRNRKFALDAIVTEVVMNAYVMAAMFEDALYCLRVNVLPATLNVSQTERILQCIPQNLRSSNAYAAADMINALCIATIFDSPLVRAYFRRILRGIALEFLEEATSARDRICSATCERLVRSAICIVDVRLKRGKKPHELIVVPGHQLGIFVSDAMENRGIQVGDAVSVLPYAGPYPMSAESLDRNMIEATVVNTNPTVVRLQDKANAALHSMLTEETEGNVYRIDKLANRMGFNRQLAAAVAFCSPIEENANGTRDTRRPCPQLIKAVTAMDENITKVLEEQSTKSSSNKGVLTSTAALCAEAIPWNVEDEQENIDQESLRTVAQLALEKYGTFDNLNSSQMLAVQGATTHRLTLVQGPPGTGKTMTALRILQHWARIAEAERKPGQDAAPILATSDSNIAVDNLVEGCAAVGLRVVRLGRPEAIRPELLRFCIDRQPTAYSTNGNETSSKNSYNNAGNTANFHKERMKQLKSAQVVCCTCIGSGGDILDTLGPLERVLVDEATQATEPAVLVPLMRGCRQLVLVGDHCQLPPTVLSTRAEEEGHGVPLFSRMVACGVPPFMLDTQYRMHPCIAMFPSDLFYGGLLKNGVSAPERRPLAGFPWPREEFPVAFIPVKGVEMDDGVSKYNELEAEYACDAVRMLLSGGQCSVSDIAVVTPYAAQARMIRRISRRDLTPNGPPHIEVSSVDGFQGREKEAVVFSAVRSNDYGAIGFTSDWRRINVSFTRARRALIVIGNDQTLRRGDPDTWMPWLAWADAHGLNVEKPGIPRGRYDPEQLRRVRGGTTAAEMLKDVLMRQQEQLKSSEKEQERAERNALGHIIGSGGDDDAVNTNNLADSTVLTLEQDIALLQNADGNWDDSDDEDDDDNAEKLSNLPHSFSKATLASGSSSIGNRSDTADDAIVDAWDL